MSDSTASPPHPPLRAPASPGGQALGWMQAGIRDAASLWGRTLATAAAGVTRGACDAANSLLRGSGPGAVASGLWRGYTTCLADCLAAACGAAAPGPGVARQTFTLAGRPLALPARIRDAAQGWAVYFVDAGLATVALGKAARDFQPVDVGAGRAPLVITGIDARDSDFGRYVEIAVALMIQPRGHDAATPLAYPLAIALSEAFPVEAARRVWGLAATLCPASTAVRGPDTAWFRIAPGALAAAFPRFGDARSAAVTIPLVAIVDGVAMRSPATRAGDGEGRQIGGSVRLELGGAEAGTCLCRDGAEACVCETLRGFDVAGCLPAANGWTETMTGELGVPAAL